MLHLVPGYTLETLDQCDIERILPFYFWDYRKTLANKEKPDTPLAENNIVYRDGKAYRKIKAGQSEWTNKLF